MDYKIGFKYLHVRFEYTLLTFKWWREDMPMDYPCMISIRRQGTDKVYGNRLYNNQWFKI